jgi:hypothetical protein
MPINMDTKQLPTVGYLRNSAFGGKMLIDEFREMVNKSILPSILNKYGFKEIYAWDSGSEYHGECTIGYESDLCRISVYFGEVISIALALGTKSDNFDRTNGANWVGIDHLISFLLKQPIEFDKKIDLTKPYDNRLIRELSDTATRFDSLANKILPMFKDAEIVAKWSPDLEQYIRNEGKRRYGL